MERTHISFDQQVLIIRVKLYDMVNDRYITQRHMFILGQVTVDEGSIERVRLARIDALRNVITCCEHETCTIISMTTSTEYAATVV